MNPTLTVVYNHPPVTPTAVAMSTSNPHSACVSVKTAAPHVNITSSGINLLVKATDPDGDKVKVEIDFWEDGVRSLALATSAAFASGTVIPFNGVLNGTALTQGTTYAWHAVVKDVNAGGAVMSTTPLSPWCYLVQDSVSPNEPVVTSTAYPTDAYAGGSGVPGVFSFAPGAGTDTDIMGYWYGIDEPDDPPAFVPVTPGTLTAAPAITPMSYGPHDLDVQAVDTATNKSSVIAYHFYVDSPTDTTAYWKFDEGSGSKANVTIESDPDNGNPPTATLSATGTTWSTDGKVGDALSFDGVTGSVSADASRIDTDQSFTVTAWVRLTSKADYATAVSQDGVHESGFYLQYSLAEDRWGFAMQSADSDTISTIRAAGSTSPQLNTWTHLAGVYDAAAQQMLLYVNGTTKGPVANTTAWDAPGTLQIGRALSRGSLSNYWPGDIDEVRVYQRVLTQSEIDDIINHDNASDPAASWAFDEPSGTTAADSSGHGHDAALESGAQFTPIGHANGGLQLDGVAAVASTAGPVVDTTKSFTVVAWVNLSRDDQVATIVSQDGTNASGFVLQFNPSMDDGAEWVFSLTPSDSPGVQAIAPAAIFPFDTVGAWVAVVGVYDAFTHRLEVGVSDVFGARFKHGTQDHPWNATGDVHFGQDLMLDGTGTVVPGDFLPGTVDDVAIYPGVLSGPELSVLMALK